MVQISIVILCHHPIRSFVQSLIFLLNPLQDCELRRIRKESPEGHPKFQVNLIHVVWSIEEVEEDEVVRQKQHKKWWLGSQEDRTNA